MGLMLDAIYAVGLVVSSPIWGYRLLRTGKWRTDWAGRLGRCNVTARPDDAGKPTLLIHAVSVGEVNLCRDLVKAMSEPSDGSPPWRVVISTTTNTGIERATQLFGARHAVVRSPLDFSFAVRRLFDAVKPDVVALAELEVWPNFVRECEKRGVPVCVINGRISERSFGRYKFIKPLLWPTFSRLSAAAAQTKDYADRFVALGTPADRVYVLDTMKWDTAKVEDAANFPGADTLAKAMGIDCTRPIIVCGSTAPGEDELLIRTCPKDAQLVIVPRKPEWFDGVMKHAPDAIRRTKHPDGTERPIDGKRIFLLDTIGELKRAYALADVVIVGRSFLGLYGSDVMEPIGLGKPTIIGPCHKDFLDTVNALRAEGGIMVTDKPGEAAAELLADKPRAAELARRGRDVILSRQGSTARHAALLRGLLKMKQR